MKMHYAMILLALVAAIPQPAIQAAESRPAAAQVAPADQAGILVQPYLQNPTSDAVTIVWRTAARAYGWVEYGETEKLDNKQDLAIDGLRAANIIDHRVRLTGLTAGKTYFYRVGVKVIKSLSGSKTETEAPRFSKTFQFRLPAPGQEKVSCYVLNDLHNVYPSFEHVAPLLRKLSPDCVFLNGDCFENPDGEEEVLQALQTYNEAIRASSFPVFYLRGNHETRGAYARKLKSHFEMPEDRFYFGYTLGPVRFIALDFGDSRPDSHAAYAGLVDFDGYKRAQADWLRREIQSEKFQRAKYHVLIHHIPIYWRERQHPTEPEPWETILKDAPIDAAICGHLHQPVILKTGKEGNPYPVVAGGGRTNTTIIKLEADAGQCLITLLDRDGKTMDTVEIKK